MKLRFGFLFVAFISIALFSLACGQAVKVKRAQYDTAPANKLGIPFYVKTVACEHQTIWLQPIYTLTLKTTFTPQSVAPPTPENKDSSSQDAKGRGETAQKPSGPQSPPKPEPLVLTRTVTLTLKEFRTKEVADLYASINAGNKGNPLQTKSDKEIADVEEKWEAVVKLAPPDPFTVDENKLNDSQRVVKVANSTAPKVYVDYSTVYYYNVGKPLAGTAQASLKLASDGTMTEGSAQVESKTLQAFLDLLPVKDVLTTVAKSAGGFAMLTETGTPKPVPTTVRYELAAEVKTFKHTHSEFVKKDAKAAPPQVCEPPSDDVLAGNIAVEEVTEPKKKSDDSEQTISVSGSIQLPKAKDEAKK